jgi:hypothetical protein
MRTIETLDLLALWERGASRHALDRSALLYAAARPDAGLDAIGRLPLGEINVRLLELRAAWFGDRIQAHVDCENCGQRLGLTITVSDLLLPAPRSEPRDVTAVGLRCRPPCLQDLAAIARERDPARAARHLLERCRLPGGDDDGAVLDEEMVRAIEDALEDADPHADLAFDVRCETCGHSGTAQLDPCELLWDDLTARARVLLAEVHQLACAYGWSERDILALAPERRASYLAMVAP